MLAPQPTVATAAERRRHALAQQRLAIAEQDERTMALWRRRHPEDVEYETRFWAEMDATRQRKAFSEEQYTRRDAGLPTIPTDDER